MNKAKKRDRWASSSDEEDDSKKKKSQISREAHQKVSPRQSIKNNSTSSNTNYHGNDTKLTAIDIDQNHLSSTHIGPCRSVYDTYEKLERISEGSYGIVWKARCLKPLSSSTTSNSIVALKQMKFPSNNENESQMKLPTNGEWMNGFPVMALREINALFALRQHTNIVTLHEIVVGGGSMDEDPSSSFTATTTIPPQIFMVMDYYHCDLKTAIQKYTTEIVAGPLLQSELMGLMQPILQGIQYMHQHNYLHRDIKPSNILVKPIFHSTTGQYLTSRIAIADFGLTRKYQADVHMTLPVATLWYRAPELLFGETQYTSAIDMWSIGCIMGELVRSSGYSNYVTSPDQGVPSANYDEDEEYNNCAAILKGRGELDQIDAIFQLLGVPTELTWPSFSTLPNATLLRWKPIPDADILFPKLFPSMDGSARSTATATISLSNQTYLDRNGHDLLRQLLQLDPQKRIDANGALQHCYFTDGATTPQIPNFSFL